MTPTSRPPTTKGSPVTICSCGHPQPIHGRRDTSLTRTREVPTCWALDCRCPAWDAVVVAR